MALKRYLVCVMVFCSVGCATVWGQATAQINWNREGHERALIPGVEVSESLIHEDVAGVQTSRPDVAIP